MAPFSLLPNTPEQRRTEAARFNELLDERSYTPIASRDLIMNIPGLQAALSAEPNRQPQLQTQPQPEHSSAVLQEVAYMANYRKEEAIRAAREQAADALGSVNNDNLGLAA